jgi:cytidylate kinase
MIIAMDGPAGSGKTTVAKLLADKLKFSYLDTGATYRALTLAALEKNIYVEDEKSLTELAQSLKIRFEGRKVFLGARDVSLDIRTPQIDKNISPVVKHPKVREVMVAMQREIAKTGDFVAEGRDVTTVVFPNADYKFYVDADFELRAKRRFKEFQQKGIAITFDQVKEDLASRDKADFTRTVGPLKKSSDAIFLDTTALTIIEVVEKIAGYIRR